MNAKAFMAVPSGAEKGRRKRMAVIKVSRADVEAAKHAFIPIPSMKTTKLGRAIPQGWTAGKLDETTWWYQSQVLGLLVLESADRIYEDGKRWHHVSVSREHQLPSWEDLGMVKRVFMGHEVTALQVLPPVSRYVNIHNFCLHLWRCLDGDVTPQFDHVLDGVRHV